MEFEAYKRIHSMWAAEEGQKELDLENEKEYKDEMKQEKLHHENKKRIHLKGMRGGGRGIINKFKKKEESVGKYESYMHTERWRRQIMEDWYGRDGSKTRANRKKGKGKYFESLLQRQEASLQDPSPLSMKTHRKYICVSIA